MFRQRTWKQRVLRYFRIGSITALSLVLLLYLSFLALMTITEQRWLGSPAFHSAIDVVSQKPHQMTLIDQGAISLAMRLEMIRSAQTSLDLEFFIYELDSASRLVAQALAAKAESGVRVRLLVDFSLAVFKLRPAYARELAQAGVQVRYYNTATIARFFSVQHRTHRKILLADTSSAIIGGRNIANDYFDLSTHYNFLDSDVLISGDIVGAMQESFDLYWDSPWAVRPDEVDQNDNDGDGVPNLSHLLEQRPEDAQILARLATLDAALPSHECPKIRFVTDYPGAGLQHRQVFTAIKETLATAKQRVVAESPYLVLRDDGLAVAAQLGARGVALTVLTNSLHSTDAYYTVSPLFFSLGSLAEAKLDLYAYSGAARPQAGAFPGSQRWGVHSKRAVIDDHTIMIGTYNIDPRSANLNSELMVVCQGSPALAAQMSADLHERIGRAQPVIVDSIIVRSHLIGDASTSSIILMGIAAPVASLFDFLL